jgi:hypothetical protein
VQQSTTSISSSITFGNIVLPQAGVYIVTLNIQLYLTTGTAIFANLNGIPSLTSIGFSTPYGVAGGYYQSANVSYFISVSSYNTSSINIVINPTQTGLLTTVYLNYSYMRIA